MIEQNLGDICFPVEYFGSCTTHDYVIYVKMHLDYVSQAVLETVAKITHEKTKRNDTQEAKYGNV
jgi:hypothetical protein